MESSQDADNDHPRYRYSGEVLFNMSAAITVGIRKERIRQLDLPDSQ